MNLNNDGWMDLIEYLAKYVEYRDICNFLRALNVKESIVYQNAIIPTLVNGDPPLIGFIDRGVFKPHCVNKQFVYRSRQLSAIVIKDDSREEEYKNWIEKTEIYRFGKLVKSTKYKKGFPREIYMYDDPDEPYYTELSKYTSADVYHYQMFGKTHRCGLPAIVIYDYMTLIKEVWFHHGKKHRLYEPAVIEYKDEKIINQEWWINGNLVMTIP